MKVDYVTKEMKNFLPHLGEILRSRRGGVNLKEKIYKIREIVSSSPDTP
jgi:hypothetical protein